MTRPSLNSDGVSYFKVVLFLSQTFCFEKHIFASLLNTGTLCITSGAQEVKINGEKNNVPFSEGNSWQALFICEK